MADVRYAGQPSPGRRDDAQRNAGQQPTSQPSTDQSSAVQQFLDNCRAEREQIAKELQEIDILAQQSASEVERLTRRNADLESRLHQIEGSFDTVPREDIQNIYTAVRREQGRLFMMRGQAELLQANRENLRRYQGLLEQVLQVVGHLDQTASQQTREDAAFAPTQPIVVRVIQAQEAEKQRLARLMHDGPAQLLTNVILQAEICQRLLDTDPSRARSELENLKAEVNKTFQRTRMLIADLRPMMLDDLGLVPTLRRYVRSWTEETGIEAEFTSTGQEHRLAPHAEVTVFRVVQEVLENASKHADPSHVKVTLRLEGETTRTIIEDDGVGFDVEEALARSDEQRKIGLALIRDRAQMLGGTLDIESIAGRGTRVVLEIPETERGV
jgi:two-component system sensor histidine kinase DegS